MPILPTTLPPAGMASGLEWASAAVAVSSPVAHLAYVQAIQDRLREAIHRIFCLVAALYWQWTKAKRRRARAASTHSSDTIASPTVPPTPPSTPHLLPHMPIPVPLLANLITTATLDQMYTTTPSIPASRTSNTEIHDITRMITNGEQYLYQSMDRVDVLLSSNPPAIAPGAAYYWAVTSLVRCYNRWHNPSLEEEQPFGLDMLNRDRVGRRMRLTLQRRSVNPWLFYMVADFQEMNGWMLSIHHQLSAIENDNMLLPNTLN